MANHVRKLQRASRRRQWEDVPRGSFDELVALAGFSLGFDDQQIADAMRELSDLTPTETSDMLEARLLELMELLGDNVTRVFPGTTPALLNAASPDSLEAARRLLEQRRGAGFVERVAQMGEPAQDVAMRIRYRKVNFLAALSRARHYGRGAKWSGKRGGWLRRYTHGARRRSSCGRVSARTSSGARGSRQRSSFGGTGARSTRRSSSAPASRSTPSGEPAARSSDRRTHLHPLSPRCAWSIDVPRSSFAFTASAVNGPSPAGVL